ncbi:site-2 protease family protein, partial [Tenacibaculum finnmarkense]
METLIKAVQFILSLSLLIVLHELGHFIPAKIFKTKVEKFYLFFDYKFSIFKKKIGDTVYGIGWIPLGGYVKIAGMIDESMDTEQLNKPAQPWEFRSKPAWQRLIIMLGGVTVNFILGIVIYICLMYTYGEKFLPNDNLKDGVWVQNQLGKDLGLQTGDKILTIDGQAIRKFSELPLEFINGNNYTIQRNGVVIEKEIPTDFISKLVDRDKNSGSFISVRLPLVIANISKDSPNINSDLQAKDIVTAINGVSTKYLDQAKIELEKNKGQAINITIQRASESLSIPVKITEKGKLGVGLGQLSSKDLEKLGYYKLA